MYWLREGSYLGILLWGACALLWTVGGMGLVTAIFDLRKDESLILGFGAGLILYLWLANIAGHFLTPDWAFSLPAAGIFLLGFLVRKRKIDISLRPLITQAMVFCLLAGFFTLIGRGLAIFDDRKNLSIISLMANGDIPPHNPLNPLTSYQYHYGSQLLSSSLVKIGGFFPWSAFDISKGIYWALTILLIYLLIRRFADTKWTAVLLTAVYPLLTGTRYLLMLLPQNFLAGLDGKIALLGSSQDIGLPFSKAIFADWVIGGGPPAGYPYGFINGILKPLVMSHSGTETLALAIVVLIWLLASVRSGAAGKWLLAILFAFLALTWESTYALLAIAVAGMLIAYWISRKKKKNAAMTTLVLAGILSIPVVLLQGGTLHEIVKNAISGFFTSTSTINAEITTGGMFTFNLLPVIFSGHLGALSIFDPAQLVVGLCEAGPSIFFIPFIWKWVRKTDDSQKKILLSMLLCSALVGLLLPAFLTYQSSARDITRFSAYGLAVLDILFILFLIENWKTQKNFLRGLEIACLCLMAVGGLVTGAVQLSALNQPVLTEGVDGWDARISKTIWGTLDKEGWIFDPSSYNWRAEVLSGKGSMIESAVFTNEDWEELRTNPSIEGFLAHDLTYIYMDEAWWNDLDETARAELSRDCVQEAAKVEDAENGILRALLWIGACP